MTRNTIHHIRTQKGKNPLVCLTAYTAPVAKAIDPFVDIILVGDSLGMTIYGMENTLGVSLSMMQAHGKAVVLHSTQALVVVDMPFGSYQETPAQAFRSAAKLVKATGCAAVKLEGGAEMAETIRFLAQRGIPVMGHVGLMPQHVHSMGGFKFQGKTKEQAEAIKAGALAVQEAGAFAIVLEGIPHDLAYAITEALSIPTIGIGASPHCDGQVLVIDDVLGMSAASPSFAKRYVNIGAAMAKAASAFADEVRTRRFPGD